MANMTKKQREFFDKWEEMNTKLGRNPTWSEMQAAMEYRSPNSVTQMLGALVRRGVMERDEAGVYSKVVDAEYLIYDIFEGAYMASDGRRSVPAHHAARFDLNKAMQLAIEDNMTDGPRKALVPIPST